MILFSEYGMVCSFFILFFFLSISFLFLFFFHCSHPCSFYSFSLSLFKVLQVFISPLIRYLHPFKVYCFLFLSLIAFQILVFYYEFLSPFNSFSFSLWFLSSFSLLYFNAVPFPLTFFLKFISPSISSLLLQVLFWLIILEISCHLVIIYHALSPFFSQLSFSSIFLSDSLFSTRRFQSSLQLFSSLFQYLFLALLIFLSIPFSLLIFFMLLTILFCLSSF